MHEHLHAKYSISLAHTFKVDGTFCNEAPQDSPSVKITFHPLMIIAIINTQIFVFCFATKTRNIEAEGCICQRKKEKNNSKTGIIRLGQEVSSAKHRKCRKQNMIHKANHNI